MVSRLTIALMAGTVLTGSANAQTFNQFIGFGDSRIDSGYFLTHPFSSSATVQGLYNASVAVGGGLLTTPNGLMNSQLLASYFGLTAIPDGMPGGTNYAAGGAFVAAEPNKAPSITTQVQSYLNSTGGVANSNALYLITSIGNSDTRLAINTFGNTPAAIDFIVGTANTFVSQIKRLHDAGARYIVLSIRTPKVPDDPSKDDPTVGGVSLSALAQSIVMSGLAAAGVNFIPADMTALGAAVGANPAAFGFTNVFSGSTVTHTGGACVNPNPAIIATSWVMECTTLVSPDAAQTYYFADNQHLTAAGQKIQADYIYSLIVAPSQVSYLAEVPVTARAGVVNAIRKQTSLSLHNRVDGTFNGWASGDLSFLRMDNFPGFPIDPGHPVSATAGFDYKLPNHWLVGAAFSVGTTKQSFSSGGSFTQDAFAASAYGVYVNGPLWGDIVGSAGTQHYDVDRRAPIGITVQPNNGSTRGSDYSVAAEAGYSFTRARFKHGPLVGMTLQRVHVSPFTETGSFTSLSFAEQVRHSAVSEIGYQVNFDAGTWRPFAKAAWHHEFVRADREVTAYLTTMTAPGYSMPAVVLGKDWGLMSVGTAFKLSDNISGLVAFLDQFAWHGVRTYGVQVGLNVAFAPPSYADMPVKAR